MQATSALRLIFAVSAATIAGLTSTGCGLAPKPGVADTPPLPRFAAGVYTDINPRWSHDGSRIAFVRATPDRRLQLCVGDRNLERVTALLEPELVSPDRPYDAQRCRYSSPDSIAWSPNDRRIAFERAEWFQFDDGQRLPGTGIWSFDLHTGRVTAIALHPKKYTNLYYYYHSPAWSPDGSYVAFVAEGINGQHLMGLRSMAVEKPKEVAPHFDNYAASDWPDWRAARPGISVYRRPRTERPVLAYCREIFRTSGVAMTATLRCLQPGSPDSAHCRELWRMRPAQYAGTPAVHARSAVGDVIEPRMGHVVWSPDGDRVAVTMTADGNDDTRFEIWVLDIRSGSARRVSPADGRGYVAPVWIDSRRLGVLSPRRGRFDVLCLTVDAGTARRVGSIDTADCDWSPDRTQIVFAAPATGRPNSPDDQATLRFLDTGLHRQDD